MEKDMDKLTKLAPEFYRKLSPIAPELSTALQHALLQSGGKGRTGSRYSTQVYDRLIRDPEKALATIDEVALEMKKHSNWGLVYKVNKSTDPRKPVVKFTIYGN